MYVNPPITLIEAIADFFASAPSQSEIASYRYSEPLDERLHELLQHSSDGVLTSDERSELDEFLRINHLVSMIKLKAQLALQRGG